MEEKGYVVALEVYEENELKTDDNLVTYTRFKAKSLAESFEIIEFLENHVDEANYSIEIFKE